MTACWARKYPQDYPPDHTCTMYGCACDQPCDRSPVNPLGLCDRCADLLIPQGDAP